MEILKESVIREVFQTWLESFQHSDVAFYFKNTHFNVMLKFLREKQPKSLRCPLQSPLQWVIFPRNFH